MQKHILISFLFSLHIGLTSAQGLFPFNITASKNAVDFGTLQTGQAASTDIYLKSDCDVQFDTIFIPENDFTYQIMGGNIQVDSLHVRLFFNPTQNVIYKSALIFVCKSNTSASRPFGSGAISLTGIGKYKESYYDTTFNLWDVNLKNALTYQLGLNYKSLGYDKARDSLFMVLDNDMVNGQGADSNQLVCSYTGRIIRGYSDRQDAQTNYNFNTEHTYPQSMFGSKEPAKSDLHHLYAIDETSNTIHSNDPFGIVTSPKWEVGGSKSDYTHFEPRNEQKGRTARSMLYFVIRYGNQSGFLTGQETILRDWHSQFKPDSIERNRNNTIALWQKNYNPFVDHPEMVDRIYSISLNQNRPNTNSGLQIHSEVAVNSQVCQIKSNPYTSVGLYNSGLDTIYLSQYKSGIFTQILDSSNILLPGKWNIIRLKLADPDSVIALNSANYTDTISIQGTKQLFQWFISYSDYVIPAGISSINLVSQVTVFPNPSSTGFFVTFEGKIDYEIIDLTGRRIEKGIISSTNQPVGEHLANGTYLLVLKKDVVQYQQKIISQKP